MGKSVKKTAKKAAPKKAAPKHARTKRSKLGKILDERGISQIEFAEMIYDKTGQVMLTTNLSNYCSGYKPIGSVKWAKIFAETLDVPMEDIVGTLDEIIGEK